MQFVILCGAAMTALVLVSPAMAASQRDWNDCDANDSDLAIAGCTRILQGRGETAHDRAVAYNNRAVAWHRKGDPDRAITDYNEAIRLDPNYALAYNNRGYLYDAAKGDYDRAIADYNEAIRLDPKYTRAYKNRGSAWRVKGDLDRAIADYSEAIRLDLKYDSAYFGRGVAHLYAGTLPKALADLAQATALDPKYAYYALWLDIVGKRNNLASQLPQAVAQIDMTKWPAPVIRLYLGQTTPEAVLAAADEGDAKTKKDQVCEANFYGGELALQEAANEEAARLFRLAAAHCPKAIIEWWAANAELKALGVTP